MYDVYRHGAIISFFVHYYNIYICKYNNNNYNNSIHIYLVRPNIKHTNAFASAVLVKNAPYTQGGRAQGGKSKWSVHMGLNLGYLFVR